MRLLNIEELLEHLDGNGLVVTDTALICKALKEIGRTPNTEVMPPTERCLKDNGDIELPLPNGGTLVCSPGKAHEHGAALTVNDEYGHALLHWTAPEWQAEPESVIGAVFGAAIKPLKDLKDKVGGG